MKLCLALIFILGQSAWALDYDPAFHLRHRYNGTKESLKGRDLSSAQQMQDPREGLKNEEAPKPHKRQKLEKHQE